MCSHYKNKDYGDFTMVKATYLTTISLLSLMLAGCSGSNDYKPTTGVDNETIFADACAGCHGDRGHGKFGFLFKIAGSEEPPEMLAEKITNGGHLMPAFPNFTKEEAVSVANYIKAQ
jgi:mono/diheme cytochrome c family protein